MMNNLLSNYAPPPEPTYSFEEARQLLPILEEQPTITYRQFLDQYPEIDSDTLTKGLLGIFDRFLHAERTPQENRSIISMFDSARQLEAIQNESTMGAFSEKERSDLLTLCSAALTEELLGMPAGLALLFTTEAAIKLQSEQLENLPQQTSVKAKSGKHLPRIAQPTSRYSILTDAISRNLPKLMQDANSVYVGKGTQKKGYRQGISSVVTMDFPTEIQVESGAVLTSYDKAILNGISSLILAGIKYFTIPMLYHAMTAVPNPSMDADAIEKLSRRLDIMRRSFITIDYTDEAAAHFIQAPLDSMTIENYLLPMSKIEAVLNGRQVTAYHVLATPPLHQYATMKRQLSLVRLDLLNAPLNNNATTIPMKNYILGRIEGMKNRHNKLISDKILFQSIFDELGEPEPSKVRRKRIRDYTETFLKYLIDQQYIEGYELTHSGRAIDGVIIRQGGKQIVLAQALEQSSKPQKNNIKPQKKS